MYSKNPDISAGVKNKDQKLILFDSVTSL